MMGEMYLKCGALLLLCVVALVRCEDQQQQQQQQSSQCSNHGDSSTCSQQCGQQGMVGDSCSLVRWERPVHGEFYVGTVRPRCVWSPSRLPPGSKVRIASLGDESVGNIVSNGADLPSSSGELELVIATPGVFNLVCEIQQQGGGGSGGEEEEGEVDSDIIQFIVSPSLSSTSSSSSSSSHESVRPGATKSVLLEHQAVIDGHLAESQEAVERWRGAGVSSKCVQARTSLWCAFKGAVFRQDTFYLDAELLEKSQSAMDHPLMTDAWKPSFIHKCCASFDPDVHVSMVYDPSQRQNARCDVVVERPVIFINIINPRQIGHVIEDTMLPLYQQILEMNNGEFTRDYLIVTNAGQPMQHNFAPYGPFLQAFSRFPVLSMSEFAALGQVCLSHVQVGLSDSMNVHNPSSPGLKNMAPAVQVLREAFGVPRAERVPNRLLLIGRTGSTRTWNQDELAQVAREEGMDVSIVAFEDFSIKEQIEMVSNTSMLAGSLGTGFVNALWLPKGAVAFMNSPFGIRRPPTRGGMEFENMIRFSGAKFLEYLQPQLHVDSNVVVPEIAVSSPEQFWEMDWGEAFSLYYVQQKRCDVPAEEFRKAIREAKAYWETLL